MRSLTDPFPTPGGCRPSPLLPVCISLSVFALPFRSDAHNQTPLQPAGHNGRQADIHCRDDFSLFSVRANATGLPGGGSRTQPHDPFLHPPQTLPREFLRRKTLWSFPNTKEWVTRLLARCRRVIIELGGLRGETPSPATEVFPLKDKTFPVGEEK